MLFNSSELTVELNGLDFESKMCSFTMKVGVQIKVNKVSYEDQTRRTFGLTAFKTSGDRLGPFNLPSVSKFLHFWEDSLTYRIYKVDETSVSRRDSNLKGNVRE